MARLCLNSVPLLFSLCNLCTPLHFTAHTTSDWPEWHRGPVPGVQAIRRRADAAVDAAPR